MGLRTQKQLQAAMELAAGRAVRRMGKAFKGDIEPLVEAIRRGKSFAGVKRSLGPTTLKRMGSKAMGEALGLEAAKAALSGTASGTMRKRTKAKG